MTTKKNVESTPIPQPKHILRVGSYSPKVFDEEVDYKIHAKRIEPWLSALVQAEHLNLLVGSGLPISIASALKCTALDMSPLTMSDENDTYIDVIQHSAKTANRSGRGEANSEDQIRSMLSLVSGLEVLAETGSYQELLTLWKKRLNERLLTFLTGTLAMESAIKSQMEEPLIGQAARKMLGSFLLSFASRVATRDRLAVYTTNYDRLIEYGSDALGLRLIDRFVGTLEPKFRSSRLGLDYHYNPPGIRGEPRYLEGVIRFSKLHGSIDWQQRLTAEGTRSIVRTQLPFGADTQHPACPKNPSESLMIYPNPAKDMETLEYPYAELFRDFAASCCQPNSVLFTYGYGFGDDHINRVIADMLTIPSTHLAVISYDTASDRIPKFCDGTGRDDQISLLIGPHFGSLKNLTSYYLPKPAIDPNTWKMADLLRRRQIQDDSAAKQIANSITPQIEVD